MMTVPTSPERPKNSTAPIAMMPRMTAAAPTAWPSVENWVTAFAHPIAPPACAGAEASAAANPAASASVTRECSRILVPADHGPAPSPTVAKLA